MRLRVSVRRYELPEFKLLWHVPNENVTVAKFLEYLNDAVPLQSQNWGVEDYVVTFKGYECLHWQEIQSILCDMDEVEVRAMELKDIRMRTLSGRHQISSAGAHLVDGLPFGKPFLRRPNRPEIRIPPLKRRKIEDNHTTSNDEKVSSISEDDDSSSVDTSDFSSSNSSSNSSSDSNDEITETKVIKTRSSNVTLELALPSKSRSQSKSVRFENPDEEKQLVPFKQPNTEMSGDDEDDGKGEDFVVSDKSSAKSKASKEGHAQKRPRKPVATLDGSIEQSDTDQSSEDSMSEASSSLSSDSRSSNSFNEGDNGVKESFGKKATSVMKRLLFPQQSSDEVLPGANEGTGQNTKKPYTGKSSTKSRNKRRVLLRRSKRLGLEGNRSKSETGVIETTEYMPNGVDNTSQGSIPTHKPASSTSSAHQVDVQLDSTAKDTSLVDKDATKVLHDNVVTEATNPVENGTEINSQTKRARLDVESSRRLLFGSLGVKTPRSKADEDRLRESLGKNDRTKKAKLLGAKQNSDELSSAATGNATLNEEQVEALKDPNFWKSRLDVTAVECEWDNVELTAPPFPFVQGWDNAKTNGKSKKNKKRKLQQDNDYLNYDYEEFNHDHTSFEEENGFNHQNGPSLSRSKDPSLYPELLPFHSISGATIQFSHLAMSKATGWQPKILGPQHWIIQSFDNGILQLDYAPGEAPMNNTTGPKYDDEGNRIYDRFEAPSEEREDSTCDLEIQFSELIEPRLVEPAEEVHNQAQAAQSKILKSQMSLVPDNMGGLEYGEEITVS